MCQALGRERIWDGSRRSTLDVNQGAGEMLHVTATSNRESIEQHGLDWRRMAASRGVAGSRVPELGAIFLCESREDVTSLLAWPGRRQMFGRSGSTVSGWKMARTVG